MRAQISSLAKQQRNDVAVLIDLILEREKSGADVTLLRQQAEQILRRASRRLRSYIQTFQNALADEAARRPALAPKELQVFETQMSEDSSRLDRFYVRLIQLSDQKARLGLNIDDETEFLERRLTERGQDLLGVLKLTDKQLTEYKQLLEQSPDSADLQAQVFAEEERSDSNRASLLATIHMLKTLGLDYVDLQVRTLELTGEVTADALKVDVALGLLDRAVLRTKTYFVDNGPQFTVAPVLDDRSPAGFLDSGAHRSTGNEEGARQNQDLDLRAAEGDGGIDGGTRRFHHRDHRCFVTARVQPRSDSRRFLVLPVSSSVSLFRTPSPISPPAL